MDPTSGDSKWVFESSEPGTKTINPTDSRFFWLANYVQPLLWVALAVLALVRLMFIWLPLVGEFDTTISRAQNVRNLARANLVTDNL